MQNYWNPVNMRDCRNASYYATTTRNLIQFMYSSSYSFTKLNYESEIHDCQGWYSCSSLQHCSCGVARLVSVATSDIILNSLVNDELIET